MADDDGKVVATIRTFLTRVKKNRALDADTALFDTIRGGWQAAPNRQLIECNAHINDPAFAQALVASHSEITR